MEIKLYEGFQSYLSQLSSPVTEDLSSKVTQILKDVREKGDDALRTLTKTFDGIFFITGIPIKLSATLSLSNLIGIRIT